MGFLMKVLPLFLFYAHHKACPVVSTGFQLPTMVSVNVCNENNRRFWIFQVDKSIMATNTGKWVGQVSNPSWCETRQNEANYLGHYSSIAHFSQSNFCVIESCLLGSRSVDIAQTQTSINPIVALININELKSRTNSFVLPRLHYCASSSI